MFGLITKLFTKKSQSKNWVLQDMNVLNRAILDSSNHLIIATDLDGTILLFNQSAERHLGYKASEVVGKVTPAIIHDADEVCAHAKALSEEFGEEISPGFEVFVYKPRINHVEEKIWTYIRKDGSRFQVLLSVTMMRGKKGNIVGYLGVSSDITEKIEVQKELEESENRFRLAVGGAQDGIWDWNITTGECYYSPILLQLIGYNRKEFPNVISSWENILHPEDKEKIKEEITLHQENKTPFLVEYRLKKKNGKYGWFEAKAVSVWNDKNEQVRMVGSLRDINQQRILEEERGKLIQNLMNSNEELEQFAYICSHDLQEPLRMITNFLDLLKLRLQDSIANDDKASEYMERVMTSAAKSQMLISGVLEYSRLNQSIDLCEEVDLEMLVQNIQRDIADKLKDNEIVIEYPHLPKIYGNKVQFLQLFQNIILNAVKYRKEDQGVHIIIHVKEFKSHWEFSISDNGIGIDEKYFEKIFEIFKRLHGEKSYGGIGLGLSICKKIVENHQGKIWVKSTLGEGTAFHFTIKKLCAKKGSNDSGMHHLPSLGSVDGK